MMITLPLNKMTLSEKFRTIETIWDDICHSSEDFSSPSWHEDVLKEREAKLSNGEDQLIDWSDAKAKLRANI